MGEERSGAEQPQYATRWHAALCARRRSYALDAGRQLSLRTACDLAIIQTMTRRKAQPHMRVHGSSMRVCVFMPSRSDQTALTRSEEEEEEVRICLPSIMTAIRVLEPHCCCCCCHCACPSLYPYPCLFLGGILITRSSLVFCGTPLVLRRVGKGRTEGCGREDMSVEADVGQRSAELTRCT